MSDGLVVRIDVNDWAGDNETAEVKGRDDIVKHLHKGVNSAVLARSTIIARILEECPIDVIAEDKLLLQMGGVMEIHKIARAEKEEVTTKKGKTFSVRTLVGDAHDETGASYVSVSENKEAAMNRATEYVKRVIPGHIRSRLQIIQATGGNVESVANMLKGTIDEIAHDLINGDS
jgi:hypothetical protein